MWRRWERQCIESQHVATYLWQVGSIDTAKYYRISTQRQKTCNRWQEKRVTGGNRGEGKHAIWLATRQGHSLDLWKDSKFAFIWILFTNNMIYCLLYHGVYVSTSAAKAIVFAPIPTLAVRPGLRVRGGLPCANVGVLVVSPRVEIMSFSQVLVSG